MKYKYTKYTTYIKYTKWKGDIMQNTHLVFQKIQHFLNILEIEMYFGILGVLGTTN